MNSKSKDSNIELPKAPTSDNSFSDFVKILKSYLKELKDLNINNSKLSQEDILVISDLVNECNLYTLELMSNFPEETQEIIGMTEKIISSFFLVFKNLLLTNNSSSIVDEQSNSNKLISFPFLLKLSTLEVKFQYLVYSFTQIKGQINNAKSNSTGFDKEEISLNKILEECESIVIEIDNIQERLNLSKYYTACSKYYMAMIHFFNKNFNDSITNANEAIKMLEAKNNNNEMEDENLDMKKTMKLCCIQEFLAQVYETLKE